MLGFLRERPIARAIAEVQEAEAIMGKGTVLHFIDRSAAEASLLRAQSTVRTTYDNELYRDFLGVNHFKALDTADSELGRVVQKLADARLNSGHERFRTHEPEVGGAAVVQGLADARAALGQVQSKVDDYSGFLPERTALAAIGALGATVVAGEVVGAPTDG